MITVLTNFVCTAYCACQICCGSHATGLDATGHKPVGGVTVALPRRFPLGSEVIIDGKHYKGTDRLAKRFDNRIDLFFNSHLDAVRFGKQLKIVTVITKN
jgi:3D (Asp-Asp-Asp) domain-containing protein